MTRKNKEMLCFGYNPEVSELERKVNNLAFHYNAGYVITGAYGSSLMAKEYSQAQYHAGLNKLEPEYTGNMIYETVKRYAAAKRERATNHYIE